MTTDKATKPMESSTTKKMMEAVTTKQMMESATDAPEAVTEESPDDSGSTTSRYVTQDTATTTHYPSEPTTSLFKEIGLDDLDTGAFTTQGIAPTMAPTPQAVTLVKVLLQFDNSDVYLGGKWRTSHPLNTL